MLAFIIGYKNVQKIFDENLLDKLFSLLKSKRDDINIRVDVILAKLCNIANLIFHKFHIFI